jgi:hypothetical protein
LYKKNPEKKLSMAKWNPLLVAIAYKKLDILRYLVTEFKLSLRHFINEPKDSP